MYAQFNHFEIKITKVQAFQGSHPGPCDQDIRDLLQVPAIKRQFKQIAPENIQKELRDYGAWDDEELSDHEANKARILWIACGDIQEELAIKGK